MLNELKRIEHDTQSLGQKIRHEGLVYQQELADRQRQGLTGDAAIRHYNDWMQRNGMPHLILTFKTE